MDPKLEARRCNSDPKCATCGWWMGKLGGAALCQIHDCKTLDLSVCSEWRDGDVLAEILPPEAE